MSESRPHIAILGAGPIGLEAALAATEKGKSFTVYEAAPRVAGQVGAWGHVRLFTPWDLDVSPRMRRALTAVGAAPPEGEECPLARDLVERVLAPVAELPQVSQNLRLGARVRRVGRKGLLKHEEIGTAARAGRPFRLLVADATGVEDLEEADAVLDCAGCSVPNTLGDGGIPALGEEALDGAVRRDIPDFVSEAEEWKGKTILLVGAGYSAQTAARDLVDLARKGDGTRVIWAVRSERPTWGVIEDDPLPARAELADAAATLAAEPPPCLEVRCGVVVESMAPSDGRLEVTLRRGDGYTESIAVDRILSLTGQVGDHLLYRQLQVHECYATSGPMKLAAALMGAGGGGDCIQQTSQGAETLRNPEPGFFILGAKSYGRRTDFLMRVGWQQVDEVFQLLCE